MRKFHGEVRSWAGLLSCAAIAAAMTACGGGGDAPSNTQSDADGLGGAGQASAQHILVSSSALQGEGWALLPPAFTNSTATTTPTSGGRVFYVETLWGAENQSTAGRDGSEPNKAWLNLKDFAKVQFQQGDTILLRCGSVWREQLTIKSWGTDNPAEDTYVNSTISNKGVKIGVYATASQSCTESNLPVIRASDYTGSWTWTREAPGSNIFQTSVAGEVGRLFRSSAPETPARYPNETATNRYAYALPVTQGPSESNQDWEARKYRQFKVNETVRQALVGKDVVGARVFIRTTEYQIQSRLITAYDEATGLVTLELIGEEQKGLQQAVRSGVGYFLQGKKWMIDQPGEWAQSGGVLYYYTPDAAPAVEVTLSALNSSSPSHYRARKYGLQLIGLNDLTIERIAFEHQEDTALRINDSSNIVVSGVHVEYPREKGVSVEKSGEAGNNNVQVLNSRIKGAGGYGIYVNRENNLGKVKFNGNYVTGIGMHGLSSTIEAGIGIRVGGVQSEAKDNYVLGTGGSGINFTDSAGLVVSGNTVVRACQRLTDCGAIYTFPINAGGAVGNAIAKPAPTDVPVYVQNNQIAGVRGDMDGVADGIVTQVVARYMAHGIYLDSHSKNIEISGNRIAGAEVGIFLHNSAWNHVHDNTVSTAMLASLLAVDDWTAASGTKGLMRGNRVIGNTWFSHRRVDPAVFSNNGQAITSVLGNAEQVYAQLWIHPVNPNRFFENESADDRNVSQGNGTLTLSKVESPAVWRVGLANALVQASGAVWGKRTNGQLITEMGLGEWLSTTAPDTGTTLDSESSPVSYKAYVATAGTSLISDFLLPQTPKTWFPNFTTGGTFSVQSGVPACDTAPSCGVITVNAIWQLVASQSVSLSANSLYLAQYNIAAGSSGGGHKAAVRLDAEPWTSAIIVPPTQLAANEKRRIELFFRPIVAMGSSVLALRPSDEVTVGPGPMYFHTASLSPISSVQVLADPAAFSVTVVNASQAARSISCSETGLSTCTDVRDENNNAVPLPLSLPARSSKRLYVRLGNWPS